MVRGCVFVCVTGEGGGEWEGDEEEGKGEGNLGFMITQVELMQNFDLKVAEYPDYLPFVVKHYSLGCLIRSIAFSAFAWLGKILRTSSYSTSAPVKSPFFSRM